MRGGPRTLYLQRPSPCPPPEALSKGSPLALQDTLSFGPLEPADLELSWAVNVAVWAMCGLPEAGRVELELGKLFSGGEGLHHAHETPEDPTASFSEMPQRGRSSTLRLESLGASNIQHGCRGGNGEPSLRYCHLWQPAVLRPATSKGTHYCHAKTSKPGRIGKN